MLDYFQSFMLVNVYTIIQNYEYTEVFLCQNIAY